MRKGISVTVTPADRVRLDAIVRDRNSPQKHVCARPDRPADGGRQGHQRHHQGSRQGQNGGMALAGALHASAGRGRPRGCARPVIAVSPVWGGFLPSPPPPTTWSACPSYWVRRRKHARSVPQSRKITRRPGPIAPYNQRGYQICKLHNVIKNREFYRSLLGSAPEVGWRRTGVGVERGPLSRSPRLARFTVLLNEGCPQTTKTVALERALPREELLLGELITVQG
jgi:hypothetical protein